MNKTIIDHKNFTVQLCIFHSLKVIIWYRETTFDLTVDKERI